MIESVTGDREMQMQLGAFETVSTATPFPNISVSDFGPVRTANFTIKPLTIFIGPNNSGKSYMALLTYAIWRTLLGKTEHSFFRYGFDDRDFLEDLIGRYTVNPEPESSDQQENPFTKRLIQQINSIASSVEDGLMLSLRDYFGFDNPRELIMNQKSRGSFSISVSSNLSSIPLLTAKVGSKSSIRITEPDVSQINLPRLKARRKSSHDNPEDNILLYALAGRAWELFMNQYGIRSRSAYYLPSARSGILTGWPLLTSLALQTFRRQVGVERFEFGALTGIAGDFLQLILEANLGPRRRRPKSQADLRPALETIEKDILHGRVSVEDSRQERASLRYDVGAFSVPLQRSSSMVAELAPLDLWLQDLMVPGDLLVIDEPEAHLHPENQRKIAKALVRMAKAGLTVIIPTHSSIILNQLSNHLLASELDESRRSALGYTEADRLTINDIAVYLFERHPDGTHVTSVPVDPEFGISEEEFIRVAESIGEETFILSEAARSATERQPK